MVLVGMDAEDETSCLLVADALYRLGRLDDAHKSLLVALSQRPQAAPVLVRLALLQLRRGFCYDANQVSQPRWAGTGRNEHSIAGDTMYPVAPDTCGLLEKVGPTSPPVFSPCLSDPQLPHLCLLL